MSAQEQDAAQYAPFDFETDPGVFGLEQRVVATPFGPLDVYAGDHGRPSALVLIHGLNGSWQSWTPLLSYAAREQPGVLRDHDLVVLDMRRLRTPTTVPDLRRLGATIGGLVPTRATMHLLGHSTGGSLALDMAAEMPDRVASVRLVSGAFVALFEAMHSRLPHPLATDATQRAMGQLRLMSRLGPVIPLALTAAARTGRLAQLASGMYFDAPALPARIIESLRLNYSGRTLSRSMTLGRCYPFTTIYPRVSVPVISVVGERDPLVDPRDNARLAAWLPQLEAVTIPGAGHFAHIERPVLAGRHLLSGLQPAVTRPTTA